MDGDNEPPNTRNATNGTATMSDDEDEEMEEETSDEESQSDQEQDATMDSDHDETVLNEEDSRFHCHLTKLKIFRLHQVEDVFAANEQVVGHIRAITSIAKEHEEEEEKKKKKRRKLWLVDKKEFSTKSFRYYFREYDIKKRGQYRGKKEPKFGTITFVYWINRQPCHGQEIPLYAVLNNRLCQAWSMLKSRRRLDFPLAIAKQILDPTTIRSADISYLSSGNVGSDKIKFNNKSKFNAHEIMAKYGIVSGLVAHVDVTSEHGKRFVEKISNYSDQRAEEDKSTEEVAQKVPLVTIQKGQISFYAEKIKENRAKFLASHFDFFDFIEQVFRESVSLDTANKWKFIDYIKQETDRRTIGNLEEKQLEKIWNWIYAEGTLLIPQNNSTTQESIFKDELIKIRDNSLMHIYQDMFDEGTGIKLFYKNHLMHDFHTTKGRAITINDVICAARNYFGRIHLKDVDKPTKSDDIKNIFIEFFNFNTYTDTKEPFHKMIADHINLGVEPNGKVIPYFQHKGLWLSLTYDTILESAIKFLDVVKSLETSNEISRSHSFELLEWNTTPTKDSKQNVQFSMEELIKHCSVCLMTDDELKDLGTSLADILAVENRIFVDEITHQNTLVTSKSFSEGAAYIDLNASILPTSKIFDRFPVSFKTKKGKKIKRHVLNALRGSGPMRQRFESIATEAEISPGDIDVFFENFNDSFRIIEKINHLKDDKVRFIVDNPYLTTHVWEKIQKKHQDIICPGRLIQFLRMKSYLKEECDYNELYHLSNCPCHSNGWLYVVGDRIFNDENDNVELFDILCYNSSFNDIYLLNVKKDFNAGSVRTAVSQVSVSYGLIWRAITCLSDDDAFQRLFRAAESKASLNSLHEVLAFRELQQIGSNEHEFLTAMQNDNNNFKIVYCPCIPRFKLADLNRYDLQRSILDKVAKIRDCEEFMKENGYVDKYRGRATGKLLDVLEKKELFVKQLKKHIEEKESTDGKGSARYEAAQTTATEICREICKTISGGSDNISLLNKSFVARHETIELAKLYSFGTKLDVNILQIPSPTVVTVKQCDYCSCQKEGASSCKNKQRCACYKAQKACQKSCFCSRTHSCGNQYGQAGQVKITDMMQFFSPKKPKKLKTSVDHGQ